MKAWAKITIACLGITTLLFTAQNASAGSRCETQYGGGEKCIPTEITINKKVRVPAEAKRVMGIKDEWIDNFLLTHAYKFAPNQEVEFQIVVENASKQNFGQVEIRDFLPSELILISDKTKFNFTDFKTGEKRDFYIKARVVSVDKFPADKSVVCPVNKAEVWTDGGTFQDSDTAQVCIAKAPVKVLPKAGPEDTIALLLASLVAGSVGIYLVMKSNMKIKKLERG
ncbi:MAG: hypothetical protein HY377_01300 [Candidatus Blackburnbacteria bacterium]|nr:hypothetical protein [Candidatus Blackburnbacteria bacterium]